MHDDILFLGPILLVHTTIHVTPEVSLCHRGIIHGGRTVDREVLMFAFRAHGEVLGLWFAVHREVILGICPRNARVKRDVFLTCDRRASTAESEVFLTKMPETGRRNRNFWAGCNLATVADIGLASRLPPLYGM